MNILITELKSYFPKNVIENKKLYDFHFYITIKYLKELFETGKTTCVSGFIRKIIYVILNQQNIKYKLHTIGHNKKQSLCWWTNKSGKRFTPGMILGYIEKICCSKMK